MWISIKEVLISKKLPVHKSVNKHVNYYFLFSLLFLFFPFYLYASEATTTVGVKSDYNSDYIVILLTFIFLITLLDFLRRIFGLGGNRP